MRRAGLEFWRYRSRVESLTPDTSQQICPEGSCTSKLQVHQKGLSDINLEVFSIWNSWLRSQGNDGTEGWSFKFRIEAWGFQVLGGHASILKPAKWNKKELIKWGEKEEQMKSLINSEESIYQGDHHQSTSTAGLLGKMRMENLLLALNNVEIVITLWEVLVAYGVKSWLDWIQERMGRKNLKTAYKENCSEIFL